MTAFALKRLGFAVITLFAVLTIVFFIVRILPGDPAIAILGNQATEESLAALRTRLGLDVPLHIQYVQFMGGVFVVETVSVMLQVASFKLTGRRIFRMAPLHHHFELKGWPEPRVIVRFWIITVILVLVGLASLKIR